MALVIADRVKESTTTTGTGALTLAGPLTGFRAFSAVCAVADECYYALQAVDGTGQPTGSWEVGRGTYSASSTLTRTTVLASSNAGAAVNLAAGTTHVWIDLAAAQIATIGGPSGATTQLQFNDAGAFAGDADLTWNKTTNTMVLGSAATPASIVAPDGGATAAGLTIAAGTGSGAFSGQGGEVLVRGGHGANVTGGLAGGAVTVSGGNGQAGGAAGGTATLKGGTSGGTGIGGQAIVIGGAAGGNSTSSGVLIQGSPAQYAGPVTIVGGSKAGGGGAVSIKGGDATPAGSGGSGGSTTLAGGDGPTGGNAILKGGTGTTKGNVVVDNGGALATSATGGFFCLPTCAGTPTGVPANVPAGCVPMIVDTTNFKLYVYMGSAWKAVTLA